MRTTVFFGFLFLFGCTEATPGPAGEDGENGVDGEEADPCTVSETAGGAVVSCPDGTEATISPPSLSQADIENVIGSKTNDNPKNHDRYNDIDAVAALQNELNVIRLQLTELSAPQLPPGVIIIWSGPLDEIPQGFSLCDGTNNTPDLRDKFTLGTLDAEDPGEIGGTHTLNLTLGQLPPHEHTGATDEDGAHQHFVPFSFPSAGTPNGIGAANNVPEVTTCCFATTPGSGAHSHNFTTDSVGSAEPVDNRPRFYRVAFIMKN